MKTKAAELVKSHVGVELPERVARCLVCTKCQELLTARPGGRWCCAGRHTGTIGTRLLRLRLFDRGEGLPFDDERQAKAELMRLARKFSRRHGITSSEILRAMKKRKAIPIESNA